MAKIKKPVSNGNSSKKKPKKLHGFQCPECGSNDLIMEGYAGFRLTVTTQPAGHVEYSRMKINQNDIPEGNSWFVCGKCGLSLSYGGQRVETKENSGIT